MFHRLHFLRSLHESPIRVLFAGFFVIIALCWPAKIFSQALDGNAGTRDFAFVEVMTTAKSMGLGENQVAFVEGTDAIGINPAGISRTVGERNIAATLRYFDWGQAGGQVAYVFGPASHRFALGASFLNAGDIEMRDEAGGALETVKPTAFSPSISYAWIGNDFWRLGATVKAYQEYLGDFEGSQSAAGLGLDVGALFSPGAKNIGFGIAVTNLGRKVTSQSFDGEKSGTTPATLKAGLFYTPASWRKVRIIAETQWDDSQNPKFGAGAEWMIQSALTLRAGLRASMQELSYAYKTYAEGIDKPFYGGEARRLGGGCTVDFGQISFDYGLQWWTDLGFVHGLTLKRAWGG